MNETWMVLWWFFANGVIYYLELNFLLDTVRAQRKWWYAPIWLIAHGMMTWGAVASPWPGMFLLEVGCLLIFARAILKLAWSEMVAPITILLTLYTFVEGSSAVVMSWISKNVELEIQGYFIQILISILMDLIYFLCLWFIRKKYLFTLRQPISSYLYILTLPCALMVLSIRYGLHLDYLTFETYLSTFGRKTSLGILFLMTAAMGIFLLMIQVFCKIIDMTEHEQAEALLKSQLEGQRIYLEEAKKRNEQYASFQHDIDNHLSILAGLLKGKNYGEAEQYAEKLKATAAILPAFKSTGNVVVDTLLKEKLSYAKGNGIQVICSVQIPESLHIDSMDLCVVFANLMDNAIQALIREGSSKRYFSIVTKNRSRFLVIEGINSYTGGPIRFGTGLGNVQKIAEKYQGAIETECSGEQFRVSILLCSKEG